MGTTANALPVGTDSGISYRFGAATRKARMAVLTEEMHSIHYANMLFWEQKKANSREASAEYYHRQSRLEEIRSELTGLID
ncbi:MAG: hypothetical protein WBW01_02180 [Terriglobales bacterium]|jgi:hypothetical protein